MTSSASAAPPRRPARPLSPHLQIYRPQMTSVLSILHRIAGVALVPGFLLFIVWLLCLASSRACYDGLTALLTSVPGKLCLFGWSWAFFYHLCFGVRHLLWDAGWFLELPQVYSTGRVALGVSTLLTLGLWARILLPGA